MQKNAMEDPQSSLAYPHAMVSLTFDGGWKSTFNEALPILTKANVRSTQYIVTSQLNSYDPDYMSRADLLNLRMLNHEIGSLTKTYADLTRTTQEDLVKEITGSWEDLRDMSHELPKSIAYPYGRSDARVEKAVRIAGYLGARGLKGGSPDALNFRDTNRYYLQSCLIERGIEASDIQKNIDIAIRKIAWLILAFPRIKEKQKGQLWSATPEMLQNVVDYIGERRIEVVTIVEGLASLTKTATP